MRGGGDRKKTYIIMLILYPGSTIEITADVGSDDSEHTLRGGVVGWKDVYISVITL